MVEVIDPRRMDLQKMEEFVMDLQGLQREIENSLEDLNMLITKRKLERRGREPIPYNISFPVLRKKFEELETRLNTVRKEMPKVLAGLQIASQLQRVA